MPSVVVEVLQAWRDALRVVEDDAAAAIRSQLEERIAALGATYQRIVDEVPASGELIAEAHNLAHNTLDLIARTLPPDRADPVPEGEWY